MLPALKTQHCPFSLPTDTPPPQAVIAATAGAPALLRQQRQHQTPITTARTTTATSARPSPPLQRRQSLPASPLPNPLPPPTTTTSSPHSRETNGIKVCKNKADTQCPTSYHTTAATGTHAHTNPSNHYARSARREEKPRGYPRGCDAHSSVPCQRITRGAGQAQASSPNKNHVTSKSPVGDISVVTLIRTDTTLDHSQKAEDVSSTSTQRRYLSISKESARLAPRAIGGCGGRGCGGWWWREGFVDDRCKSDQGIARSAARWAAMG